MANAKPKRTAKVDPKAEAKGTTPTQIRFTDDDHFRIEAIRVRFGLPSMAAAIRHAIGTDFLAIPAADRPAPPIPRKKISKKT